MKGSATTLLWRHTCVCLKKYELSTENTFNIFNFSQQIGWGGEREGTCLINGNVHLAANDKVSRSNKFQHFTSQADAKDGMTQTHPRARARTQTHTHTHNHKLSERGKEWEDTGKRVSNKGREKTVPEREQRERKVSSNGVANFRSLAIVKSCQSCIFIVKFLTSYLNFFHHLLLLFKKRKGGRRGRMKEYVKESKYVK